MTLTDPRHDESGKSVCAAVDAVVPSAGQIRGIIILIAGIWGVNLIMDLTSKLSSVIGHPLHRVLPVVRDEPAVNWLAARGWRRGSATGLIFLGVFLAVDLLIALGDPSGHSARSS